MDTSTLHDIYEKDHKGAPLTLDIINGMMEGEDDIDVGGATFIVQPNIQYKNGQGDTGNCKYFPYLYF